MTKQGKSGDPRQRGACIYDIKRRVPVIHESMRYRVLLYLPTQISFLIGGERVTCHWSKVNDALGRTKLNATYYQLFQI